VNSIQQEDHGLYSSSDSPSNLRLSIRSKGDGSRKRNHAFKGYKEVSDNSKNVSNQNNVRGQTKNVSSAQKRRGGRITPIEIDDEPRKFSHLNLGGIPQQPGASSVEESSLDHGSVDLQFDLKNGD
jgi:hypothetical protein